ncbi:MAG TPA: cupin domain-containing protein [Candidatus Omnitrophota bacterium]|nr:cupin domain-containing protein [Candidatus Omnitrophota bacterium]HPS37033.1 cupin domain-containing protein [Candidatus Omnitrophota bacterium]
MFIRRLKDCKEIVAGDACHLRELLNARTDGRAYRYSLAHAVVKSGEVTKPHALKTSEVYYILEGKGRMHIGQESAGVGPGDVIDIPPEAVQYIENTGTSDLVFICIVDPAWRPEDEVVSG